MTCYPRRIRSLLWILVLFLCLSLPLFLAACSGDLEDQLNRKGRRGATMVLQADLTGFSGAEAEEKFQALVAALERRCEVAGFSGHKVEARSNHRLTVKVVGVDDPQRVKSLLTRPGNLELRLVRPAEELPAVLAALDAALLEAGLPTATPDSTRPFSDLLTIVDTPTLGVVTGFVPEDRLLQVLRLLDLAPARAVLDRENLLVGTDVLSTGESSPGYPLYLVEGRAALDGRRISSAQPAVDVDLPGRWQVAFSLDRKGARDMANLTEDNPGRHLAICLDGRVYSAPRIQGRIPDGKGVITGNFTLQEANDMAVFLNTGALPLPVAIVAER
jgi:SecD/SecF fusion protein